LVGVQPARESFEDYILFLESPNVYTPLIARKMLHILGMHIDDELKELSCSSLSGLELENVTPYRSYENMPRNPEVP
jgi:hypothetical protein